MTSYSDVHLICSISGSPEEVSALFQREQIASSGNGLEQGVECPGFEPSQVGLECPGSAPMGQIGVIA